MSDGALWMTDRQARKIHNLAGYASSYPFEPSPSYVYFVKSGQGEIKIGIAVHPGQRIKKLQTGNPSTLELLAVIHGGEDLERSLHQRFQHLRLRGEWFSPGADLVDFIRSIAGTGAPDDA